MKRIILSMLFVVASLAVCNAQKRVLLETTEGNIVIELYDDTPIHRDNFLKLVSEHFYDSLLFHRVIYNFMIQTGSADSRHAEPGASIGHSDLDYTLEPEFRVPTHYHRRGAVAMAREGDKANPERRSSACQFYIVWGKPYSTLALQSIQEKLDTMTNGQTKITPEMEETYRKYIANTAARPTSTASTPSSARLSKGWTSSTASSKPGPTTMPALSTTSASSRLR